MAIIHRTVRWVIRVELLALRKRKRQCGYNSLDCPVSQRRQRQRSFARSTCDTWLAPLVGWVHRTIRCAPDNVRCANRPRGATVGCDWYGRRSHTGHKQWLSGGAPDCPVHHSTEGKDCLPNWSLTAPSCLGAIKGTPRRMEQNNKLLRNILRLPDFVSTHLIRCVSDLSSVWVANSLCCVLSSSLGLCAWLCCGFMSCVCVALPTLLLCFLCDLYCKGERLQPVEIPRNREEYSKIKTPWYSSWSLDRLKGVECNPRPLGRHNVEVGKCYLAEPRDKNRVSLVLLSLWLLCSQELASKLLSRTNTLITKFVAI
jgi:hypothetical protein